jgi:FAD/FMN-containing dehydrogenase
MRTVTSWGRYPNQPQVTHEVSWPQDVPAQMVEIGKQSLNGHGALAFGCGRSYGDSCFAASNHVLAMSSMNRVLAVNWQTGVINAQAGLTLADLIQIALPHGWFLPVSPGTKFVTLGGAVANDVHGKNHHVMGTFGSHVRQLVMHRTDHGTVTCSLEDNSELFAATVGGLGLTGVIVSVELQLRRVNSSDIEQRSVRFEHLSEFFELSERHDAAHEYTVAWVDCLATGNSAGRGHYITGDHAGTGALEVAGKAKLIMPFDPPFSLVNAASLRAFNSLYYNRQQKKEVRSVVGYNAFFYPLDGIQHWNRMYGRQGFQQYQCVVPLAHGREVVSSLLQEISRGGTGSFLAVLKRCGSKLSPGWLSFPMEGVSLALDFPQRELINKQLFDRLDAIVAEAGGRLYPAKDAHMQGKHFRKAYPMWERLEKMRDPQLLSQFWKRVTQ